MADLGRLMDYINNKDEKIGALTVAISNDRSIRINRLNDVTTVTVRDRKRAKSDPRLSLATRPLAIDAVCKPRN